MSQACGMMASMDIAVGAGALVVLGGLALWAWLRSQTLSAQQFLDSMHEADEAMSAWTTPRAVASSASSSWLDDRRAEQIIVHTVQEKSISGLLVDVDDDGLVLQQARYLDGDGVDLGGQTMIPRHQVAFIQSVSV